MAIKLRNSLFTRLLVHPMGKAFVLFVVVCGTLGVGTFTFFYVKYARLTDQKIKEGPFSGMSLLYAAPRPVMLGDDAPF